MITMMNYNITDYRKQPWEGYKDYYTKTMYFGECDPSYISMNYVCDRLELNPEQRYWMAFIFGTNYSVTSTYYIINEFPDFENVNVPRLERWWKANKDKLVFITDRAKVKHFDFFVKIFESYRDLIGDSQVEAFKRFKSIDNLEKRYEEIYNFTSDIYYFGRFSLFNYMESLHELTDLKMSPNILDLKDAESSRNGLCYACNYPSYITMHHKKPKEGIDYPLLQWNLTCLKNQLQQENPEINVNFFNIETTLCAWKKLFWGSRYFGYYVDRQLQELNQMQDNVKDGVDWSIMWNFRKEFFHPWFLGELNGWKGIRKSRMNIFKDTGQLIGAFESMPEMPEKYSRKVEFKSIGNVYKNDYKRDY